MLVVKESLKVIENDFNYKLIDFFKTDYYNEIYSYLGFSKYFLILFFIIKIALILSFVYVCYKKLLLRTYKYSNNNLNEIQKEYDILNKKINEIPDDNDYLILNNETKFNRKKLIKRQDKLNKIAGKIDSTFKYDYFNLFYYLIFCIFVYGIISFISFGIICDVRDSHLNKTFFDGLDNVDYTESVIERIEKLNETEFLIVRNKNGNRINEIYSGNVIIDDNVKEAVFVYKDYPEKEFYSDLRIYSILTSSENSNYINDKLKKSFKEGEFEKSLKISSKKLVELSSLYEKNNK